MLLRPPAVPPVFTNIGLVGWWPFSRGLIDESGHPKQNGRFGGTAYPNIGFFGNSVTFPNSATAIVTCGPSPSLTKFSVCGWLKPNVTTRGDCITSWTTGSVGGGFEQFNLLYGVTSGKPQLFISDGGSAASSGVGSNAMLTGNWYHICGTYDGATIRIYLNGVQEASSSSSLVLGSGVSQSIILGNNAFADGTLNGHLGDCRLYNRALSAAEVFTISKLPFLTKVDIAAIALMRVASGGAAATPWLYVNNNLPVLGAGTY